MFLTQDIQKIETEKEEETEKAEEVEKEEVEEVEEEVEKAEETETERIQDLVVCVAHSSYDIKTISDHIEHVTGSKPGASIVMRDKSGRDTGMVLVLLERKVFQAMTRVEKKGCDFRIRPFVLRKENLPPKGHGSNFFIPYPKDVSRPYVLISQINRELSKLSICGLLKEGTWRIMAPSRDKSHFYVIMKDVPVDNLAIIRLFLYNSGWDDCDERILCLWSHKNRKGREGREGREKKREKKEKSPGPSAILKHE